MQNILILLADGDKETPKKATSAGGINYVGGATDTTAGDLTGNIIHILNGIIAVLGLACVVVMIIGGVSYMTSAGDTAKVEKGKKTILYGLIGLIICVLSFAIVNFVIGNIIGGKDEAKKEDKAALIINALS